ncbi:MAG: glycosyltransferase family 39 protein [Deltaproteobacteria bacterium]|nr:glycosyltransferase family 39 protein [Deltaproteobacteria bacterium]
MTVKTDQSYLILAWAWVLGFTLFRLIYANFFLLAPDEANYWQWSRYLAWGYHDQSPMIAWAIRLSTYFLGHTELGVRLPSIIAMAVAALYLVSMAARWVDCRAAFNTALITQAILEFNVGGLMATPDGLQAAAWAGAAYHVARAYEGQDWAQWLASGIWFGVGMLSKYTMVIFLPAALGYGLFSPLHRRRLASLRPYVGVLIGSLMFMPVVIWNAANNWNSLRHVAHIGGINEALAIHWEFFGDYLASQAGLLSPIVFVLGLMAWLAVIRKGYPAGNWIYPYLVYTSLPIFAGFALLSLHTRVYGNWPGAGYLTAAVLTAALYGPRPTRVFTEKKPILGRRLWPWAVGSSYVITALVLIQTVWPVLPIPAHMDRPATELGGWRELGLKTYDLVQTMPNPSRTFIFGLNYQTASELAFYTPTNPQTVSINRWSRPNVYDYWWKDDDLMGWDAVGVTYDSVSHWQQLNQVFEHVDPPVKLDIFRPSVWSSDARDQKKPVKTFFLYRAYGFKGGMRWRPPDSGDIRAGS